MNNALTPEALALIEKITNFVAHNNINPNEFSMDQIFHGMQEVEQRDAMENMETIKGLIG